MNLWTFLSVLVFCHLIGDYVLQNDYIAKTKGNNFYNLLVHCTLYCLPFILFLSVWQLMFLWVTHIIIDSAKARYSVITYEQDQLLHYLVVFILGMWCVALI